MNPLYDISLVCKLLRNGIDKKYWTIEDLDYPSMGWNQCEKDWLNNPASHNMWHRSHRNLLRNESDTDIL